MLEATVLPLYLLLSQAINFNSNKNTGNSWGSVLQKLMTDIRVLHHQIYPVLLIPQYFYFTSLIAFHLQQLLCQKPY